MEPIINLTYASHIAPALAYVGELATDLWYIWVLAVGLPLGFWVLSKIIKTAKGGAR